MKTHDDDTMEPKLWECILRLLPLFRNHGVIMDAWANDGTSSLALARAFPNFTIMSIDPIQTNLVSIHSKLHSFSKRVVVLHGGFEKRQEYPASLDSKTTVVKTQTGSLWIHKLQNSLVNTSLPVYTVDDLMRHRTLAFAHWDVEGNEIELLQGARATIRRDRPLFTVEAHPKTNATKHAEVIAMTKDLGYTCLEISEECGSEDCINLVCVPTECSDCSKLFC